MLKIRWYHYYSYWIFIWFILYKLNIIKYSPSFSYIFAILFITMLSLYNIYLSIFTNTKSINFINLLIKCLHATILDIIPFILLYPFTFDYTTLFINILVLYIYYLFMNRNIYDIFYIYINSLKTNYMTFNQYKQFLKYNYYII